MTKKEITLNGKTYPVVFTIKTMMGFENIVGHSFFDEKTFSSFNVRMAIIIAAILAANKNADIPFDEWADIDDMEGLNEFVVAFNTVMKMSAEFFHIPEVIKKDESAQPTEDNEKNV